MLRRQRKREAGFNMAEVAFALLVLGVGLASVVGFFPQGLYVQMRAQDRTSAANIASRVAALVQSGNAASVKVEHGKLIPFDDLAPSTAFGQQPLELTSGRYFVEIHREDAPAGHTFLTVRVFAARDVDENMDGTYFVVFDAAKGETKETKVIEGYTTTLRRHIPE